MIINELKQCKSCELKDMYQINYIRMPITKVCIEDYNEIIEWCTNNPLMKRGVNRTPSGGISLKGKPQLNVWESTPRISKNGHCTGCELIVIYLNYNVKTNDIEYFGGRIQIGQIKGDETKRTCGRTAYLKFRQMLSNRGLNIADKFITKEEGIAIKEKIQKPMIMLGRGCSEDAVYEHAYHLDINSSYASGMKEICPDWGELIDFLYLNRKKRSEYKDVLNMAIGFFQSQYVNYQLAHISEYCIRRNNEKLTQKAVELIKHGCKILAFNTDGLWFTNPKKYEIESTKELGGFKIDHADVTIRFKSPGVYEYIENGVYTPVVRGTTTLDRTLDRSQWKWGDIYKEGASVLIYEYKNDGKIIEKTMEQKIIELEGK